MRKRTIAGGSALGASVAVAALVVGAATGSAAVDRGTSLAFGVHAALSGIDEPSPFAISTDGGKDSAGAEEIPLGDSGEVHVEGVMAGENEAASEVSYAEYDFGESGSISVTNLKVECAGPDSTATADSLTINGADVELPAPGELKYFTDLEPEYGVVFHEQGQVAEGVDAANGLAVYDSEMNYVFAIGGVACGGPAEQDDSDDEDESDEPDEPEDVVDPEKPLDPSKPDPEDSGKPENTERTTATQPVPTETKLPVTG
ncbi:hypothetical protein H0B56_18340 [Haloechinothrix sp. YIM 98757]|uniref:Uncharacterized protein n=1 Tax=Haloechinothrix aidingensis TaxID=2752311 RepID=A0A838AEF2_9PSEU|nr:hypothetical protein [Haloechinothrix aidingensis]MBA0127508.1 hypothetical protein [Haloechinothrix aidingensis]